MFAIIFICSMLTLLILLNQDTKAAKTDPPHKPKQIPLEKIDLIDEPRDPRRPFCPDDIVDLWLILPTFFAETRVEDALAKNRDRNWKSNGAFKRSTSYVRQQALQSSRLVPHKRVDPRLDRYLFADPPKKVVTPPISLNKSQPKMRTTLTSSDTSELDDVSSNASMSPVSDNNSSANNRSSIISSPSESDDDCTFQAYKKRKVTTRNKKKKKRQNEQLFGSSSNDERVPAFKIDLKKGKVTPVQKTSCAGKGHKRCARRMTQPRCRLQSITTHSIFYCRQQTVRYVLIAYNKQRGHLVCADRYVFVE